MRQSTLQAHASWNKVCRPSNVRVPQSCLRWCFHLACNPLAAACNPGETRQTFRPFPLCLSGIPVRNISNILQLLHFPSSSDRQYKSRHIVFQFATVRHFLCGAYLTSRFKTGNRPSRIGLTACKTLQKSPPLLFRFLFIRHFAKHPGMSSQIFLRILVRETNFQFECQRLRILHQFLEVRALQVWSPEGRVLTRPSQCRF